MSVRSTAIAAMVIMVVVASCGAAPLGAAPPGPRPALAGSAAAERLTIDQLLKASAWPRRAIAAVRLERFGCKETLEMLERLRGDHAWQVRAFAAATLGRRRAVLPVDAFDEEEDPRVLRAALRHRYPTDPARLERGIRFLAKQSSLDRKMLAVELAAASGDPEMLDLCGETARTIILRMTRGNAGSLSPRLAAVTGSHDHRRHYRWQQWLMRTGRSMRIRPVFALPPGDEPAPTTLLARLDAERFADLEDYIESLQSRRLDLVICLDTTASMWGELAQAQAGLDDMMLFAGDVVARMRVGIMAYRDKRDRYETKGWDLTDDVDLARRHLWELSADGGGDSPEAVYPAMRLALGEMGWVPSHIKVLVLVGDAPPHVGYGSKCVDLARRAHVNADIVTHAIQTTDDPVPHFCAIAEAGGGRCTTLGDDDSLVSEIAGLSLGERFGDELREFFRLYLQLCR